MAALEAAQTVARLTDRARDWVNTPPNHLTPAMFADAVLALGKELGGRSRKARVDIEVLEVDELERLGCGGILGVGGGSANPPRLVKLTWAPADARASIALVGKGITYDSGGLTIKPGGSMATMKYDMGGAAAVLAATFAIAELDLPVAVTTYAPMAENMPSGNAMRPGDVLTMYGGRTVEVTNTDAEGRLILADALAMAAEQEPRRDPGRRHADRRLHRRARRQGRRPVRRRRDHGGRAGRGGDERRAAVPTAHPRGDPGVGPHREQDRRRAPAQLGPVGVLALRGGLPRRSSSATSPGPTSTSRAPRSNEGGAWGHVPTGATGYGVATLVAYAAALAGASSEQ